jgi:rhamnosyltransferase subunit B
VPLRVLFVPFGSEGDVNPLLWLAEGMAARGHEPTFVITPHYGPLIEERGYPWIAVGTKEEFLRCARDPRIWSRMHGPGLVMEGMIKTLPAYRQAIEVTKHDFDLIVLSTLALAAASVAEEAKIPRLTLHMQPALFRSVYECPVFMEELARLTRAPRSIKRLFFALVDVLVWERVRRRLNAFRDGIGLPPLQTSFMTRFTEQRGWQRYSHVGSRLHSLTGQHACDNLDFRLSAKHVLSPILLRTS